MSYWRNIHASFTSSRFIDLQVTAIEKVLDSKPVTQNIYIADDLKSPSVVKFDADQLNRFAGNLSAGILVVKGIHFWAYQLDRYRESPAVSFFSFLSYAWLFFITVITMWLVNLALLKVDPSLFRFEEYPSNITVLYYALSSLYLNGIPAMEPVGDLAIGLKILAGVIGVLLLATFAANLAFGSRQARQKEALSRTVAELRERGRRLESRLGAEYEITVDEAIEWLIKFRSGMVRLIQFLTSRIPGDFR